MNKSLCPKSFPSIVRYIKNLKNKCTLTKEEMTKIQNKANYIMIMKPELGIPDCRNCKKNEKCRVPMRNIFVWHEDDHYYYRCCNKWDPIK